ncbi:hypothetical protein JCGZ_23632 [Jatropha curcas]|uniref:Uncharacterized protein n=1 Tax=Jatropha curcas TaxID=180498 RepID=A0A067L2P4_JATCU|nr:hypothetical protein JCGZ_23632 [Jatropha curcas]
MVEAFWAGCKACLRDKSVRVAKPKADNTDQVRAMTIGIRADPRSSGRWWGKPQ